jgi:hypothetical protein
LERPFLYVNVSRPGIEIVVSPAGAARVQTGVMTIDFFNCGRTTANLTRIEYLVGTAPRGGIIPPIDPKTVGGREVPYGTISFSNDPYSEDVNLRLGFWEERDDIAALRLSVWVTGFARYRDIFGAYYITGFTQVFDPVGQRFVRRGNNRYNYGRQEKAEEIPPPSSQG